MMRSDFDRSVYIIDRFPLFGGSQIRMHTGEDWRTSRGWLKDLLTPQYMQTVAGPAIHSSVRQLMELWELSSCVAGPGRPFSMLQDLKILALDVMTQFHHGNEFRDLALRRQIQYIRQLEPNSSRLAVGPNNGVTLPRAPMNVFGQGVTEIGDRMAAIYTMSSPPGLISWWTQHIIPRYRKFFAAKQSLIRSRINIAIKRLRQGEEAKTGIDHMVYREEKAAIKAGRQPLYEDQIMVDEVRISAPSITPHSSCPCRHPIFQCPPFHHTLPVTPDARNPLSRDPTTFRRSETTLPAYTPPAPPWSGSSNISLKTRMCKFGCAPSCRTPFPLRSRRTIDSPPLPSS